MLLDDFKHFPLRGRQYLERHVNDGSPSGFSELNRTSYATDPLSLRPYFYLYGCRAPSSWFKSVGSVESTLLAQFGDDWIPIHPDMISHDVLKLDAVRVAVEDSFKVVPTASSRTVQILSTANSDYIKLHYDGILGRVYRALPFQKAVDYGLLSESIAFLPECAMRYMYVPGAPEESGVGMIWRRNQLVGKRSGECEHVWPSFSLFSTDRLRPLDMPILIQLIMRSSEDPAEYLLNRLLFPLVDFYFDLAIGQGLQIECNAQNVMVGLDGKLRIVVIVLRDLMRCEKDLPIRRQLGLSTDFQSAPYKCIDDSDPIYSVRHSFSFDFKFSYYLVKPLIEVVHDHFGSDESKLLGQLREYVLNRCPNLPKGYFPEDSRWYKHDRILLTGERPYVECRDPLLR